jgi:hypothetical protein
MTELLLFIRYQQVEDEGDTCLFTSMASCLFYMGRTKKAATIYNNRHKSLKKTDRFELLASLMKRDGRLHSVPIYFKEGRYNPMRMQSKYPTACQLIANDGGIEHAVTFYRDLIFDSSEERALKLTEENLKYCTGSGYLGSYIAIRFQHGKN